MPKSEIDTILQPMSPGPIQISPKVTKDVHPKREITKLQDLWTDAARLFCVCCCIRIKRSENCSNKVSFIPYKFFYYDIPFSFRKLYS